MYLAVKKIARYLPLLLLTIICAREAKADVITFDDVSLPPGGSQQIVHDRYLSQGVVIYGGRYSPPDPVITSTTDAHTPQNILWSGPVNQSLGDDNSLSISFYHPGTLTPSATNFISFYVIDNGTQPGPWSYQILVSTGYGTPKEFFLTGSGLFSYTSAYNDIWSVHINFLDDTAFSGIDTLTFNPPTDPIPEPATIFLLGTGLAGVGARVRRRRQATRNR